MPNVTGTVVYTPATNGIAVFVTGGQTYVFSFDIKPSAPRFVSYAASLSCDSLDQLVSTTYWSGAVNRMDIIMNIENGPKILARFLQYIDVPGVHSMGSGMWTVLTPNQGGAIQSPSAPLNTSAVTPSGLIPLRDVQPRLASGYYSIKSLAGSYWGLADLSDAHRVIAPLMLINAAGGVATRFHIQVDDNTGFVQISSTSVLNSVGQTPRYLSDGPNLRPRINNCRLFGVPGQPLTFFVCTDTRTQNPLMVLQDPHPLPGNGLLPVSVPFDIYDLTQRWTFIALPY